MGGGKRRDLGVVPGDGRERVDPLRLERGDRAAAGPVVGCDDADDLLAEPGDLAADPLLRVGRRPVRRVEFGQRAVPGFGQRVARPLGDQLRGGVGRRRDRAQQDGQLPRQSEEVVGADRDDGDGDHRSQDERES